MKKIAVILTVFNRREVTLQGLHSLYKAINCMGSDYRFDIYMTNDGCTDGTAKAVRAEFPDVKIIQGNGSLYWSGGMRKAWQAAIGSGVQYDYYLWFNDDAELYEDALVTIFETNKKAGEDVIISGAFCDMKGNATYGGWNKNYQIITPDGTLLPIYLMNGNLVLIPDCVVEKIGIIDKVFIHSLGDWDYGRRAQRAGFHIYLTGKYVGVTERHDEKDNRCFNADYSLSQRWRYFHNSKYSSKVTFIYNTRHDGIFMAVLRFFRPYFYILFPYIYTLRKSK